LRQPDDADVAFDADVGTELGGVLFQGVQDAA